MPISFDYGFSINSKEPIDSRMTLTSQQMRDAGITFYIPDRYFAVNTEDGKLYVYDSRNTPNPTTGRFSPVGTDFTVESPLVKEGNELSLEMTDEASESDLPISSKGVKSTFETLENIKQNKLREGFAIDLTDSSTELDHTTSVAVKMASSIDSLQDGDLPISANKVRTALGFKAEKTEVNTLNTRLGQAEGAIDDKQDKLIENQSVLFTYGTGQNTQEVTYGGNLVIGGGGESIILENSPSEGSQNAVKSGGIYTALQGKADNATITALERVIAAIPLVTANPEQTGTDVLNTLQVGDIVYNIEGGGGTTRDYTELENKPQINGVTLDGDKTGAELGLCAVINVSVSGSEPAPTFNDLKTCYDVVSNGASVVFKTPDNTYYAVTSVSSSTILGAVNYFVTIQTENYQIEYRADVDDKIVYKHPLIDENISAFSYYPVPSSRLNEEFAKVAYKSDLTDVIANPTASATGTLNKLKVGKTVYNVPSGGGTTVEPNPPSYSSSTYLQSIKIAENTYRLNEEIKPNVQDTPTRTLSCLKIGNYTYSVASGVPEHLYVHNIRISGYTKERHFGGGSVIYSSPVMLRLQFFDDYSGTYTASELFNKLASSGIEFMAVGAPANKITKEVGETEQTTTPMTISNILSIEVEGTRYFSIWGFDNTKYEIIDSIVGFLDVDDADLHFMDNKRKIY